MLTMLIQASAIVKNGIGDSSLHGYVELQETTSTSTSLNNDAEFDLLNCISDILVQDTEVLAASYCDSTSFTVVTPSSDFIDMDSEFPPHESVSGTTFLTSLHAAVVPNPDDRGEGKDSKSSGPLGEIREIGGEESLWIPGDSDKEPLSFISE